MAETLAQAQEEANAAKLAAKNAEEARRLAEELANKARKEKEVPVKVRRHYEYLKCIYYTNFTDH